MTSSTGPTEHLVATRVHGRVLVATPRPPGAPLLVGCHGYGENAERHLEVLDIIPGVSPWLRCAVDALHPFYNRRTGEVVGSWMTRRLRTHAMGDNTAYVCAAVAELRRCYQPAPTLVLVGFSQGVAMAYRAAAALAPAVSGLVVLAGDVPPDVAAASEQTFRGTVPRILLGRGTEDDWYTQEKMQEDLAKLATLGAEVETCVFPGGHTWSPPFLAPAGVFLGRIAQAPGLASGSGSSVLAQS